jgi:hypothetical protein
VAPDEGSKKALIHLLTREIPHTHMFLKAVESLGKPTEPLFGNVQPDKTVNLYYHLSSDGKEARGPWNEAPTFECIAEPVHAMCNSLYCHLLCSGSGSHSPFGELKMMLACRNCTGYCRITKILLGIAASVRTFSIKGELTRLLRASSVSISTPRPA